MIWGNSPSGCIASGEHNSTGGTSLSEPSEVTPGVGDIESLLVGVVAGKGVGVGITEVGLVRGAFDGVGITKSIDLEVELQAVEAIKRSKEIFPTQARIRWIIKQTQRM